MKEINGIRILEEGDDHTAYLPEGLILPYSKVSMHHMASRR